jgi:hypothetical protein
MSLSTNELAQLRSEAEAYQAQTCTINRITDTEDGAGGWTESSAEVAADVACRLAVRSVGDIDQDRNQVVAVVEYTLTVPHDQDLEPKDQVVIGGETYVVEAVLDEHQWKTAKRCKMTRVE